MGNYIVASCEVVKFPFANSVDRVYSTHARAFVPTSVLRGADVHFGRANCAKDPMLQSDVLMSAQCVPVCVVRL